MDSASVQFVLFGLAAALISNVSPSRLWRSAVLMLASLLFLGLLARDVAVFIPFAEFLLLGYAALFLLSHRHGKALVWCVLAIVLSYAWLKKYTFLPHGLFLQHPYFTLGLSYIFFRVLHLLIDAGDEGEPRMVGLGGYLLYTLNFTTLVSGPIQRYEDFSRDQFADHPIPLGPRVIGLQLERIVRGFFKVNVLAALLDTLRTHALVQLSQPLPIHIKLISAFSLTALYPFFLYANFSGYIDIVIALARLMRIQLPENFDRPFSASSFLDFWNRWHITLSTWLKTYVFNPLLLALMRRGSSRALLPLTGVLCLFVTFFLVGIWHGRTSEFAFFGVLQGGGVAVNKLWQMELAARLGKRRYKALAANAIYVAFARGLTFSWFSFTLTWFWSNWRQIGTMIDDVGLSNGLNWLSWFIVWASVWLAATIVLVAWEWLRDRLLSIKTSEGPILTSRYARVVYASTLGFIALIVTVLLSQPAPPIVYKAF